MARLSVEVLEGRALPSATAAAAVASAGAAVRYAGAGDTNMYWGALAVPGGATAPAGDDGVSVRQQVLEYPCGFLALQEATQMESRRFQT